MIIGILSVSLALALLTGISHLLWGLRGKDSWRQCLGWIQTVNVFSPAAVDFLFPAVVLAGGIGTTLIGFFLLYLLVKQEVTHNRRKMPTSWNSLWIGVKSARKRAPWSNLYLAHQRCWIPQSKQ